MNGDPKLSLTLKLSSWKNIFRVLKWTAPMDLQIDERVYFHNTGEHWSTGNFWAAVQELERQVSEKETAHG